MGKVPLLARQGLRYAPYSNASLARRRRGSPPPDGRGIRAGSHRAQLTGGIFGLLEDLNTRYGSRELRKLFRDHANQPGALGHAIETWTQYDDIRGARQLEPTDFLNAQRNDQSHCNYVPEPILGDENRASRPPLGQPDACHVPPSRPYSEHPDAQTTNGNYPQHLPQTPRFNYTPPGETLFDGPPNSPCTSTDPTPQTVPYSHPEPATSPNGHFSYYRPWFIPKAGDLWEEIQPQGEEHESWGEPSIYLAVSRPPEGPLYTSPDNSPSRTGDELPGVQMSPPLGSLLRVMRGVAAPPLISLPPSKLSAVHESSNWSDNPVVNGHNEQDCISPRSSEESYHAAFWETAGWTPEDGYRGSSEDGPRIPPNLKGKGRARQYGPNEADESPEEQDSSGCSLPQPGNPPYGIPVLANTVLQVNLQPVSPETPIKLEPQDEDSILITWHEEGRQDGNEEPEHEQHPAQPQPQPQPQPRRSARIKAMKEAAPSKVKPPTKSTGRKRAVRKK